jgi:hypothetical protein
MISAGLQLVPEAVLIPNRLGLGDVVLGADVTVLHGLQRNLPLVDLNWCLRKIMYTSIILNFSCRRSLSVSEFPGR